MSVTVLFKRSCECILPWKPGITLCGLGDSRPFHPPPSSPCPQNEYSVV